MKFWITDGVFHRELTIDKDYLKNEDYQVYEDKGTPVDISEDSEFISIPAGVTCIGKKAFKTSMSKKEKKWKNLKRVVLPESVTIIDDSAFEGCSNLADLNIPKGLEKLGAFALYATGIRTVKLPEGLKEIDNFCFSSSELTAVTFPKSPTKIENQAFNGCRNLKHITVPDYINEAWGFSGCTSLEEVENLKWDSSANFCECHSLKKIIIPDGAKSITMKAFMNCFSLQELTIPSSVKDVWGLAFTGCTGLKKLTIKSAFKGFETAFPDSKDVSEVYTTESISGKARIIFPKATIYNLKGKLLFSSDQTEGKKSETKNKTSSQNDPSTSPAVDGELIPKSNVYKFTNYTTDVNGLTHSFHVEFSGSQIGNRFCKSSYTIGSKGDDAEKLYDAEELIRANGELYIIEPHSGVRIPTLSEDYESLGEKRSYSMPLNNNEIILYVQKFSNELACCLTDTSIAKIVDYVPHKKNGTLAKNRTTLILRSSWADSSGNALVLMAKNVTDNDLDLNIKKVYIGDDKFEDAEAARIIGIINPRSRRKDMLEEKLPEIKKEAKTVNTKKEEAVKPVTTKRSTETSRKKETSSGTAQSKKTTTSPPKSAKETAPKKAGSEKKPAKSTLSNEDQATVEKAQKALNDISEQIQSTSSALETHAENQRKIEEAKNKRIAEAKARGKSSKDESFMLALLLIEEEFGHLDRSDEEFTKTYTEDFGAYSELQLIELRRRVKPLIHDKSAIDSAKEVMLSCPVKDRFGILTANWFNLCNDWNFDNKGEAAIEKTRQWYRDNELSEVRRLMEEHKTSGIQSVNTQLSAFKSEWNSFTGVKNDLCVAIQELTEEIPGMHNLFDIKTGTKYHVFVQLKHPSMGFLTIPVMNLFASVWETTPEQIWSVAINNKIEDARGKTLTESRLDANIAKEKALLTLQKTKQNPPKNNTDNGKTIATTKPADTPKVNEQTPSTQVSQRSFSEPAKLSKADIARERWIAGVGTYDEYVAAQKSELSMAEQRKDSGTLVLLYPRTKTEIRDGEYALYNLAKNIIIPDGVVSLGKNAFRWSSVEKVVCPDTLRIISDEAFLNCKKLQEIELNKGLEEIGFMAFGSCTKLMQIHLPDSVKKIDRSAFLDESDDKASKESHITLYLTGALAKQLISRQHTNIIASGFVIDGVMTKNLEEYSEKLRVEEEKQKKEEERKQAEEQKRQKASEIKDKIQLLQTEMNSLKGLFSSFKRKKLQQQINDFENALKRI